MIRGKTALKYANKLGEYIQEICWKNADLDCIKCEIYSACYLHNVSSQDSAISLIIEVLEGINEQAEQG
jgi:hypothetical protein